MSAVRPLPRPPVTLAERFWSLARGMEGDAESSEPQAVVRHVLAVLDALEGGEVGGDVTAHTLSFLHLLRQQEAEGDLLYASPEQARGEGIDERSLVFSVGVLLFERLTGRHPFGAEENPLRVARIRKAELASGVNYFPKVPAELRHILLRAMGPFPQERFADLRELRDSLEAYAGRRARRARTPAPLPGMEPTTVFRRPPSLRFAPREVRAEPARFDVRIPRPRTYVPALWMLAGAAVASLVFFLAFGSDGGDDPAPAAAGVAPGLGPTVKSLSAAEAAPATSASASDPASESASASDPASASGSDSDSDSASASDPASDSASASDPDAATAPPAPADVAFDADIAGRHALQAARACFSQARLVEGVGFGATLVFTPRASTSRRVFFAGGLEPAEQRCLAGALTGLSAGAPPAARTLVQYNMHLSPRDGGFQARVSP